MAKKPPGNPNRRLTPAQQLFADLVIAGGKPSECYSKAYPSSSLKGTALSVEATRTKALPHVWAYIENALAERRNEVLLTRDKKRQVLGKIALSERTKPMEKIAAVREDNAMTGDSKIRFEGEVTLQTIFLALQPATALPGTDEIQQLKPAVPVAESAPQLVTAMERAG